MVVRSLKLLKPFNPKNIPRTFTQPNTPKESMFQYHYNQRDASKKTIWYILSRMKEKDPAGLEILQSNLKNPEVNKLETAVLLRYHAEEFLRDNQIPSLTHWPLPKLSELKTIEGNREGLGEDIDRYSKLRMMIDKRIIQLQLESSYEISMFYEEYRDVFETFVERLTSAQSSSPTEKTT